MTRLPLVDGTADRVYQEAVADSITPSDVIASIVAAHYGAPTVSTMLRSTSSAPRASAPVPTETLWTVKVFLPHADGVADRAREQAVAEDVSYGALVASIVQAHYGTQERRSPAAEGQASPAPQGERRLGISA